MVVWKCLSPEDLKVFAGPMDQRPVNYQPKTVERVLELEGRLDDAVRFLTSGADLEDGAQTSCHRLGAVPELGRVVEGAQPASKAQALEASQT